MPVHNADIAAIFTEIADLLEIEDANPFRVRAYRNAARILGDSPTDIRAMVAAGQDLRTLPGIGEDLAGKIREIIDTGQSSLLERLRHEVPPAIADLMHIPNLGPKRVRALWHDLDIQTPEQLYDAAREGRIRTMPGFGERSELRILQAVESRLNKTRRMKIAVAAQYAEPLRTHLAAVDGVERVELAGSYRRRQDTVGDLDILAVAADSAVVAAFTGYEEVAQVPGSGPTRAAVVLKSGLQVDLRVVARESYGAALCYFTGSRAHGLVLRRLAQERGLKLNEYGLFKGNRQVAGDSEASIYEALGLPWIPPELREDRGEIEAARAGRLPHLIEMGDLRGDLHAHTRATDGHDDIKAMAAAAAAAGLEYMAITDHSRNLAMVRGLDPGRLARQIDEIDRVNEGIEGIRVLKGIEVDILEDGSLDLPDSILERLDVVVGAVHSQLDLPRARQTARILKAMDNRHFNVLAHPTGRLLEKREPYAVDMLKVIRHARRCGCILELDCQPERLDLPDTWCMAAKEEGVLISIDSDAHGVADFANHRFGVGQGRRGWLEAKDVLNTRPLAELQQLLKR